MEEEERRKEFVGRADAITERKVRAGVCMKTRWQTLKKKDNIVTEDPLTERG